MNSSTPAARPLELRQLTGPGARVLIWAYFVTISAIALLSLDDVHLLTPVYVGIAAFALAWLALTLDTSKRVRLDVTLFVIVLAAGTALLLSWNSFEGGFSQWYVGAGALVMFYLCLRGRNLWAWIGFALIACAVLAWGLTTQDRFLEAVSLVARQAPFVLVGSLFSYGMGRTSKRLEEAHSVETARAAAEAAALARSAERSRRLTALDIAVGPQLRRIANGDELTATDRQELLVAEARLRDSLRARQLDVPEIVAAAQRARRRSVTVVLLDDRYPLPLPPHTLASVIDGAVSMLDAARDGAVTIRLLPAGRDLIATFVADGSEYTRVEIPSDANSPA